MASVGEYLEPVKVAWLKAGPVVRSSGLRGALGGEGRGLRSRLPFAQGLPYGLAGGAQSPLPRALHSATVLRSLSRAARLPKGPRLGCSGGGEGSRGTRLRPWECTTSGHPSSSLKNSDPAAAQALCI